MQSAMENMLAQPAKGLETPRSSTKIVSKVLSQTSVASTFLKNAGLETPGSKSTASATRETQLREQLQAEKIQADLLQQELDTLKKKGEQTEESLDKTQEVVLRTQQEMEEFKKKQEVNDLILQCILNLNSGNRATQLVCSYACWVPLQCFGAKRCGYVACELCRLCCL